MKRILALLCIIACLCGLCVPAMAADTIMVCVKAPEGWSEVYLYAWESEPYSGWPGTQMMEDDGWYFLEIPAGYTNVIANNGSGEQTNDLKMDGSVDTWIKVTDKPADKYNGEVYLDADCTDAFVPEAGPVGTVPMALVGTGIPGAADWTPGDPAGDMTCVSEGVYTKVVALTGGTTMTFKVAGNDTWDNNYNFGGAVDGMVVGLGEEISLVSAGDSKNLTLTVDMDCNLKFTLTLVEGGATLLVEETEEEADPTPDVPEVEVPDAENITIYAKVPEDWTTVHLWAWKDGVGDVDPSGWPGTLIMTKGEDGWYSIQIPGWAEGILLHNGSGIQTPDMVIEAGKDVWVNAYTDPNAPVFAYAEITDIQEPSTGGEEIIKPPITGSDNIGTTEPQKTEVNNTLLWTLVGSGVIVVIAAGVIVFLMMKKKKAE